MIHRLARSPWSCALSLLLPGLLVAGCDDDSAGLAGALDEGDADIEPRAGSVVASFQDGVSPATTYAGTADTTLQEDLPAATAGAAASILLDRDAPAGSGKSLDGLLRFDLGGVPPGSTVESVKLTVQVLNKTSGEGYALYAGRRAWSEAQATWTSAASGSAWASGGARGASDRGETPLGTLLPLAAGKYTVTLNSDGIAAVQGWIDQPASNHGFVLDASTNMDGVEFASAEAATASDRPQLVVTYAPPLAGGGLLGQYYAGTGFQTLVTSRTDPGVDFSWAAAPAAGVPADGFSVRWTGQVAPLYSQTYTFFTSSDDGVRLWVDGVQLINNWTDHGLIENSGQIALVAGQKYDIKLEYYEKSGGAAAKLSWSSATQAKQVIPAARLFPASAAGFVHPGILVSKAQLDAVKAQVAAKAEPWNWQINKAKASKFGQKTYVAKPVATMLCGNSGSTMDQGCSDSRNDALAAYTLALLWYYTGDQGYADAAIDILDAWSLTLKSLPYVSTDNNTFNGPLQAAWLAELFPRSAEILRHTGAGWPEADAQRFGAMLGNVLLPRIVNGWYGGGNNWNSSMANGVINIGIYNDDVATYNKGVALWRLHLPYGMYQKSDGASPRIPAEFRTPENTWKPGALAKHWHGQAEFATDRSNGITVETCRDLSHTQMGLAGFVNSAETARIQGLDLFGEQQARILASHEFVARALNEYGAQPRPKDVATPSWLCNGTMEIQDLATWEIVYNHYVGRKGLVMDETAEAITRIRASEKVPVKQVVDGVLKDVYVLPYTNLQMAWETLTHGVPDAAL